MTGINEYNTATVGTTERKFKLSTPLRMHSGEEKTEITLKMPGMRAFIEHGFFLTRIESGTGKNVTSYEKVDYQALKGFAAAASGVPAEMFDNLAACDVHPLVLELAILVGSRPLMP